MCNISQASATQRAGRRDEPARHLLSTVYTPGLRPVFGLRHSGDKPADLAEPILMLDNLGLPIEQIQFLDAPLALAVAQARGLLGRLCVLGNQGLSERGKKMLRLPLHPRLSRLVLAAQDKEIPAQGCLLAALLAERDIRLNRDDPLDAGDSDLLALRDLFNEIHKSGFLGAVYATSEVECFKRVQRVRQARDQLQRTLGAKNEPENDEALEAILLAYPDQVARTAVASGKRKGERDLVMVGGGRAALHASSVVRDCEWVVALDVEERQTGTDRRAWARLVSRIEPDWLLEHFEDEVEAFDGLEWMAHGGRDAISQLRYGSLVLEESRERPTPDGAVTEMLITEAMRKGAEQFVDMNAFGSLLKPS